MIATIAAKVFTELKTPLVLVTMRVGGAFASFILSLLMARTMDPADMGVALTCLSVAPLATLLVTGSTEAGCLRFLVAYREKNELDKFRGMVSFNRIVTLVLSMVFLLVTLAWLQLTASANSDIAIVVILTAIATVLLSWQKLASVHVMSLGHVVRAMTPSSFCRQVGLLAGVGLWALAGYAVTKEVVVSGLVASVFLVLILQYALNHGPMQRVRAMGPNLRDYSDHRAWTKVGLQLGITLLFVQFSRDLTLVFSSLSLSPEDIAVLGIATAVVGFAKFYVIAVNQSLGPQISQAVACGKIDEIQKKIAITNHLKFWPMVLMLIVFWAAGEHIAAMFGPGFESIAILLPILALDPLALAFFGPGGHFLSMTGHQFVMLPLSIATILVLACAITIGAHFYGLVGAAYGCSIAWIFWTASLALLARKYVQRDFSMVASTRMMIKT